MYYSLQQSLLELLKFITERNVWALPPNAASVAGMRITERQRRVRTPVQFSAVTCFAV
jgi:hypothetical protein